VDKNPTVRVATALLVLLVPISIVIFGLVAPAAAGGPPSDNELLITVAQTSLWESQAGQLAQDQAASQAVKDLGARITKEHEQLGTDTRELAGQLGVSLPTEPTEEQQSWLSELTPLWGPDFDASFVRLLRDDDRKVLASIKAGADTGNGAVRSFARKATDLLDKDVTLLNGTGLVDASAAPEQPAPVAPAAAPPQQDTGHAHGAVQAAAQTSDTGGGGVDVALVIAICLIEFAVTLGLVRLLRSR
jgi:predicted outer membrane protein